MIKIKYIRLKLSDVYISQINHFLSVQVPDYNS